ncbi:MAG: zinc ribbon domain-containing protein [Methylotenera sp.]|nr:zinc ribbon domain-containing protein [Methylotenera sp.]
MPIYDYQCSSCGFKQEVMRKVSAPNVEACPHCQALAFSKQLSAPSFQLTGSGWYATDFKGKSSGSSQNSETTSAESDPKPAACNPGCACH